MGRRRQAREHALQALYLADAGRMKVAQAMRILGPSPEPDEKTEAFALELASGTEQRLKRIDGRIRKFAANWDLERMAVVDRNILRLASYEILYQLDTPVSVIIDEALEIAKIYSSEDSGRFLNGILDRIKTQRRKPRKA